MCVGLGCPLAVLLSGVVGRGTPNLYFRLMFVEFMSNLIGLKKNECHQSSIFKLPSVARDKSKPEAKIWSDGEVKKSDESDGHIEVQKLIRRRQG